MTAGVELLAHIRDAFGEDTRLATVALLERLRDRDESPWKDIYGKPLDDRGLAKRLKAYGIKSKPVRLGQRVAKGFATEDFYDVWKRYLPASAPDEGNKGNNGYNFDKQNKFVTPVTAVTGGMAEAGGPVCQACDGFGCPTCRPQDHGLPPKPQLRLAT